MKQTGVSAPKSEPNVSALTGSTELSLSDLAIQITARGNDMEIRSSKDGLKVFEVSKRLVGIIAK